MERQESAGHRIHAGRPISTLFLFPGSVIEVCDIRQAYLIRPMQAKFPSQQVLLPVTHHELLHALPGRVLTADLCPDPVLPQEPAYLTDGESLPCQVRHHHVDLADPLFKAFVFQHPQNLFKATPVPGCPAFISTPVFLIIQRFIINRFGNACLCKDLAQTVSIRMPCPGRVFRQLSAKLSFLQRTDAPCRSPDLHKCFFRLGYQHLQSSVLDPQYLLIPYFLHLIRLLPRKQCQPDFRYTVLSYNDRIYFIQLQDFLNRQPFKNNCLIIKRCCHRKVSVAGYSGHIWMPCVFPGILCGLVGNGLYRHLSAVRIPVTIPAFPADLNLIGLTETGHALISQHFRCQSCLQDTIFKCFLRIMVQKGFFEFRIPGNLIPPWHKQSACYQRDITCFVFQIYVAQMPFISLKTPGDRSKILLTDQVFRNASLA